MSDRVIFLTHADVAVAPDTPVPNWGLNPKGQARHEAFASADVLQNVRSIYASAEQKAQDGAAITAEHLRLPVQIRPALGENDRSATGYLPEAEFWPVVRDFFKYPDVSTRGWETARDAQTRIRSAVVDVIAEAADGDILIVAHGGVATLLRCALLGKEIAQDESQPHPKGGCWFAFPRRMDAVPTEWNAL